jgi:hypothetical protein
MKVHQRDGGDGLRIVRRFENLKHNTTSLTSWRRRLVGPQNFDAFFQRTSCGIRITSEEWPKYANGKRSLTTVCCRYCIRNHPSWPTKAIESADLRFLFRGSRQVGGERMWVHQGRRWTDEREAQLDPSSSLSRHVRVKIAVRAVLEHHFDNHEFCGDWCVSATGTAEEWEKLRFRKCAIKNFTLLWKHHEQFMEDEKCSNYSISTTQHCQGFNSWPSFFQGSHVWTNDRKWGENYVSGGSCSRLDDNSSNKFFHLPELGCVTTTSLFCLRSEGLRKLWKTHRKMETVKITRMRTLYKKLREGCVN